MRLPEKYRPQSLTGVVGQDATVLLQAFAEQPYASCWLLEGPPGVGKTTTALALAEDLGCSQSVQVITCSELSVDRAREAVRTLRLSPGMWGGSWNVLVLEELESLSTQCQVFLKGELDASALPGRAIVIATSNGTGKLQPAVVQRFNRLLFRGDGGFANAAQLRIAEAWLDEAGGVAMPKGWTEWGWNGEGAKRDFSLRLALEEMEMALLRARAMGRKAVGASASAEVEVAHAG